MWIYEPRLQYIKNDHEISCPYLPALQARFTIAVIFFFSCILFGMRFMCKPFLCPSMLVILSCFGVVHAFFMMGSCSTFASFGFVVGNVIWSAIFITLWLLFYKYYVRYYKKIGENFYGWKACVYIQAGLIFVNAAVAVIWQIPNHSEIATSSLTCNVAGFQQLKIYFQNMDTHERAETIIDLS
ncbi:Oidioi.mRNA.OKI2018_I69.PAR.g11311.t1.cds [Oikopleura dioica]|uniref:Oidioi.mRNA.OKI2018_I69.PAR.g11311.t1.cds n=1 Tax=Oikopleura dioica TaxID=34765 RepID=A0ABN7RZS7_OIKDI|nr:Oidioi.mRNA.OKI2018_I69.PAR.g11311.t1.cds [Oikopleura dioica]